MQGFSSVCVAAQTQRRTECTRLPETLAGVCSPAHPEADSLGAQQLPHTRSFPSALLPSRSEEHTSELQSPTHISYAVFCLKKNFFNDTATTEIYTLSLHDALPILASAPLLPCLCT